MRGNTGRTEVKSFDVQINPPALRIPTYATVPTFSEPAVQFTGITELNDVQQGAAFFERIGSKIVIKSIHLGLTLNATTATTMGSARVMLLYDRQSNGASPAFADLLRINTAGAAILTSGLNMQNKSRFLILRDQYFNLDPAQSLFHTLNWHVKGRWETEFKASGNTIGDIATGSLLLVVFSGVILGGGDIMMNDPVCRIRYWD